MHDLVPFNELKNEADFPEVKAFGEFWEIILHVMVSKIVSRLIEFLLVQKSTPNNSGDWPEYGRFFNIELPSELSEEVNQQEVTEYMFGMFSFWKQLNTFEGLVETRNSYCKTNPNLQCGVDDEIEALGKKLMEQFTVYKMTFEPITKFLNEAAKNAIKNASPDSAEYQIYQKILECTQQLSEYGNKLQDFIVYNQ